MTATPHEPGLSATSARRRLGLIRPMVNAPFFLLLAVAMGACAIRLWTVRGGLPFVDHPDEPNPIDYVVGMLRTGDPNPHAFQKPSLYVYLLLAVLSAHYRWGRAAGLYGPLDQMAITTHLYTTIPGFFLWGRLLTVVLATLTVVCVYRLGRRVWGVGAGLLAALLLALSPFHMRHSQYVTTDVASALLVLLALGASIAVAREGRWRDYLAAGAFAGLAASTKYNAGVVVLTVGAAHVLFAGRRSLARLPRLAGAGAAALLGFVIGTPYAVLSWAEFRQGILGQVRDYAETAHGDFSGAWNLRGYGDFFVGEGLGWAVGIAALAGLALLLWRRRAVGLLWLSFAVPYLLLHLAQTSHFTRNMLPLIVLSMLPAGVAGAALIERLFWRTSFEAERDSETARQQEGNAGGAAARSFASKLGLDVSRWPWPWRGAVAGVLLLALLLPSAIGTGRYTLRLRRGDTRVHALEWLGATIPPGVRVAAELRPLPGPLESPWAEAPDLLAHDLAWYRRQGYGYLVASSDVWQQWALPAAYDRFAGRAPVAEFGGADPRDMLGPHLAIYPTGLAAADVPAPIAGDARVGATRLLGVALGRPDARAPWLGIEPAARLAAGATLGLRTFWNVEQPFGQDYYIFVHLVNGAGATVAQRDAPPWQGRFPTSSWRAGSIVVDINDLVLPATLPPGVYTLVAGMFDPATGAHPPMSVDGRPVDAVPIGQVTIGS
jgi:4-amino-4-deoxy-L-arabinose transferase-like glycosyltransferase